MTIIKEVTVAGVQYPVIVSDDDQALLAAAAAGRAIIGIWEPDGGKGGAGFDACPYLVCDVEAADPMLLERVVRRHRGLPWLIAETKRLLIREFTSEDPLEPISPDDGNGVFSDGTMRDMYIKNQYRFHECGLWALVEKKSGHIIGKAGLTGIELGYHIYEQFRRRGYAFEALSAIIDYAVREQKPDRLIIKIKSTNLPSVRLAKKLGFSLASKRRQDTPYTVFEYSRKG